MTGSDRIRSAPRGIVALGRRHRLLLVLLLAGAVLRLLVTLAYRPALLYVDSLRYLENVRELKPDRLQPIGYDLVLWPLLELGGLQLVVVVQHLAGLAIGVALYALALRLGVRRGLAVLAAAPVLLDGYQLQIEQNIMAEVTFEAILVGTLWLLLGGRRLGWRRAGLAGLVLGLAVPTRTIAVTLVPVLLVCLLLAGAPWRAGRAGWLRAAGRTAAGLAGVAAVVGGYLGYVHSVTGDWSLSGASTAVRYGRAAVVADCARLPLGPDTRPFCPPEPRDQRKGVDFYVHDRYGNSKWPGPLPPGRDKEQLAKEFSSTVLRHQPVDVALAVLADFAKGFAPVRDTAPGDVPLDRWQFQLSYPQFGADGEAERAAREHGGTAPAVNRDLARVLRAYQLHGGYTPGTLLGVAGLLALAAAAGLGRARRSGLRAAGFLTAGSALALLLGSAAFEFSWRYQLPGLVLLPIAGVIGLTALLGSRRQRLAEYPDPVDLRALADFRRRHGEPAFAPVLVVIAAYNEEAGIGGVLAQMPATCAGLPVDVLVVVDGGSDATAEVAAGHGGYVCVAPRNRGQGAALRLGYRLAVAGGARFVVTTDADGQYDNSELPALLAPILDGDADFVTGSRRLGREDADSRVRWLGVRVFAALASVLTRRRITDTSFGFRAMRAGLAGSVTLREPQYQSSELLLGVLARGARVVELPMTMRRRGHGASKKGRNLVYGANYARVMLGTWWREFVRPAWRTRTGRTARTSA